MHHHICQIYLLMSFNVFKKEPLFIAQIPPPISQLVRKLGSVCRVSHDTVPIDQTGLRDVLKGPQQWGMAVLLITNPEP